MKETIICAFPGCAKSTVYRSAKDYGFYPMETIPGKITTFDIKPFLKGLKPLFDSDSSLFDKTQFPDNYLSHIKNQISALGPLGLTMFISSHDNVRTALGENNIPYTLVYPKREIKEQWIQRYVKRGSPEAFIKLMTDKWDDFIDSCVNDTNAIKHVVLDTDEDISKAL